MKPAPLHYRRAGSIDHAVELLVAEDGDAKILAGGQSLVPLLSMRLAQPTALVDLGGLPELSYIRDTGDSVEIGAMTRTREVETSPLIGQAIPLLPAALRYSGHVTIRNRGTLGGSAAHADPAGEVPSVLRALDAQFVVAGPRGQRTVAAADWFHGFLLSAVEPDELLVAIQVPKQQPGTGVAVEEFARRHGDFALVAVFGALRLDPAGLIAEARLTVAGAGSVPIRADAAEQMLTGQTPGAELIHAAASAVAEATEPGDDIHAPAEYRRTLSQVLARRCLDRILPSIERSAAA
ncbi:FAD binding domain-containing protein [Pseudonocardia endophytica]|uniref:Carbon-monoxide dehydrogenase medium subunit n=1 Tax=Pseudonocardia endophytica TaxID=401976 RepID=A0A4R1HXZ1_PSEEN|nr:xanthine dehydrogenase family protein subunit M [Pseudonocardia endophytica]TCK26371.1 carbon-monoxide dehydrogenase medium subunit [Pseudonocardia endophytica]